MIKRLKKSYIAMFDLETLRGNACTAVLYCAGYWYMLEGESLHIWFHNLVLGVEYNYQLPSDGEDRTRRIFATGLFFVLALSHTVYLFLLIREKLLRRRAKKSAQGQWYDTENLTKEDLYADKDVDDGPK